MSVEFEEEGMPAGSHRSGGNNMLYSQFVPANQPPKIILWVLKTGIVKEEKHASWLLAGLVLIALLIAVFLFWRTLHGPTPGRFIVNENVPYSVEAPLYTH